MKTTLDYPEELESPLPFGLLTAAGLMGEGYYGGLSFVAIAFRLTDCCWHTRRQDRLARSYCRHCLSAY